MCVMQAWPLPAHMRTRQDSNRTVSTRVRRNTAPSAPSRSPVQLARVFGRKERNGTSSTSTRLRPGPAVCALGLGNAAWRRPRTAIPSGAAGLACAGVGPRVPRHVVAPGSGLPPPRCAPAFWLERPCPPRGSSPFTLTRSPTLPAPPLQENHELRASFRAGLGGIAWTLPGPRTQCDFALKCLCLSPGHEPHSGVTRANDQGGRWGE